MAGGMPWRASRPIRTRSKPPGLLCLANPPCHLLEAGWLHEIKFDGYRVIARKGVQVRLWAGFSLAVAQSQGPAQNEHAGGGRYSPLLASHCGRLPGVAGPSAVEPNFIECHLGPMSAALALK